MSYYLCIDCGGTKAAAVVANPQGIILGRGVGGPANFKDVELSAFIASVRIATERALSSIENLPTSTSGVLEDRSVNSSNNNSSSFSSFSSWFRSPISSSSSSTNGKLNSHHSHSFSSKSSPSSTTKEQPRPGISLPSRKRLFKAAWIGVSGVDRPQDIKDLTPIFSNLLSIPPGPSLIINNDTNLLASPLHLHPDVCTAVVAISGTGCIVVSFEQDPSTGTLTPLGRAGGWGWLLGDEGSGYFIGREALRRILEVSDHASSSPCSSATPSPTRPQPLSLAGSGRVSNSPFNGGSGNAHASPMFVPPATPSPSPPEVDDKSSSSADLVENKPAPSPGAVVPSLQDRIFEHFGISSAPDIFTVVYAPDPPRHSNQPSPSPPLPSLNIPTPSTTTTHSRHSHSSSYSISKRRSVPQSSSSHPPPPSSGHRPAGSGSNSASYLAQERKARLTALTPIVFNSALKDRDPLALSILHTSSSHLSRLIAQNLSSPGVTGGLQAASSVLCFGGSLVGVPEYRAMVVERLGEMGHVFRHVEYVGNAAESGVQSLISMFEGGERD